MLGLMTVWFMSITSKIIVYVYLEVINILILKTPCSDLMLSSSFERIYGTYSFLKIDIIH
jgi:hypothetical protein